MSKAYALSRGEGTSVCGADRNALLMATIATSARNSPYSYERGLYCMAVVIYAEDVFCSCLALVSVAHLCEHLFPCCACADIEHASNACMGLAQCAVTLVTEKCREFTIFIVACPCLFFILPYVDIEKWISLLGIFTTDLRHWNLISPTGIKLNTISSGRLEWTELVSWVS